MSFFKLSLLFGCLATVASSDTLACKEVGLSVSGADAQTRTRICDIASDIGPQFEKFGVSLDRPIEIEIVEGLQNTATPCLGVYHCGEDRIEFCAR